MAAILSFQNCLILPHVSEILSTILSQLNATAVPREAAPPNMRPKPRAVPTPVKSNITPIANAAAPMTANTLPIVPCRVVTILSQLNATAVPREAAPANIKPRPRAVPAPVKSKIVPIAKEAAPMIPKTLPIVPSKDSTMLSQFNATAVPSVTAPAAKRAIPKGMLIPENASIPPIPNNESPTAVAISVIVFFVLSVIESQLRTTAEPNVTAPAAIKPIPRGILTPVKARIAPIPSKAPPTIYSIPVIVLDMSVFSFSQFKATAAARETAPPAISAIPRGIFTPVNASTAPNANNAPPTIPVSVPIAVLIGSDIESQFKPTEVARVTAPAAKRAIPSGTETPVNANNAPIANKAPPTIPVSMDKEFSISPLRNFQFITPAVTNDTAPPAIRAIPRGTFTPVKARNAPIAKRKPAIVLVTTVKVLAISSDIVFQFTPIDVTKPTAPTAIRAIPSGIFTPVTARIVPIANDAPLITTIISSIAP